MSTTPLGVYYYYPCDRCEDARGECGGHKDNPLVPCRLPPVGWWCSREAGHEGPCAASPKKVTP